MVCRSGASSLAELTAFGKPAVVAPYPYAIGDHQMKNARHLEAAGAVRIIPDSELASGALVKAVVELMSNEIARAPWPGSRGRWDVPRRRRVLGSTF